MVPAEPVQVRSSGLPTRSSVALLQAGRQGLADAATAGTPAERFSQAHLAALRAAAAVLAARAKPGGRRRGRPSSVWALLVQVAPALSEWAEFFAAGATKRAAAEAGLPGLSQREADDLMRAAETFLDLVERALGGGEHLPLTVTDAAQAAVRKSDRDIAGRRGP
jgi:hypothetical protein